MVYFIFSLLLALSDIWLIELYLSKNMTLSTHKYRKNYITFEIITLFLSYALFNSNIFISFIALFFVLLFSISQYNYTIKELFKYLLLFLILHTLFRELGAGILNWIFNIKFTSFYFNWSFLYKLLVESLIRYFELIMLLYITKLNTKKEITLRHFKFFTIFLSLYLAVVLTFNNDKLFIFPNIGRTFVFVIIVYNIALIFFDRFQTRHEQLEYDHKQLKNETSSDSVYFQEHLKGSDDIRGIKHDMKNHMLVLKGYIESDSKKTALEYIQTIENEIEIASSTFHTGISTVDSIITSKVKTMEKSNIKYKEKFKVICLGDIYDRDLALMLASALDNAIEAAAKSEDKKISLQMGTEVNYLCITLINSIKRNSKPNFNKTSKEDSTKHGFGYKKIKTIVKKYDGDLETVIKKDKVIMIITLKLN